jgi:hypothetical protein
VKRHPVAGACGNSEERRKGGKPRRYGFPYLPYSVTSMSKGRDQTSLQSSQELACAAYTAISGPVKSLKSSSGTLAHLDYFAGTPKNKSAYNTG